MSQMPYPCAAKSPLLSSMVSATSAEDSGAPSNRNRRTSGCVQWASSAGWSSCHRAQHQALGAQHVVHAGQTTPAGHRAVRLPGTQ